MRCLGTKKALFYLTGTLPCTSSHFTTPSRRVTGKKTSEEESDIQKEFGLSDREMQTFREYSKTVREHTIVKKPTEEGEKASSPSPSSTAPGERSKETREMQSSEAGSGDLLTEMASTLPAETTGAEEEKDSTTPPQVKRQRRRNRKGKTSMDSILGEVIHEALNMRDSGGKPTMDFVYKRAQERMYEEEYGTKPPSSKDLSLKIIPFPPDFRLHRLIKVYPDDPAQCASRNGMAEYSALPDDPWPERAITRENPVWSRHMIAEDEAQNDGRGYQAAEAKMYTLREGADELGEFIDAMDEFAYWEAEFINFLRTTSLPLRRHLPLLHEWYRFYTHRTIRGEKRYIARRNDLLPSTKGASSFFRLSEESITRFRTLLSEAHRSLASANYDPLRMKKSSLAPYMRMDDDAFNEWKVTQREKRNFIVAELS